MLRTTLRLILASALLTGSLVGAGVAYAGSRTNEPPLGLREALNQVVAVGNPGVIAYAKRGTRRWQLAAGVSDLATGRPAQPGDRWRIFSNTKSFVSTVLLQLEGERRLSLDDTVERWLPGVVRGNGNDGRKITVRQLLNNTSGIWDPNDGTDRGGRPPRAEIAVAMTHPPLFPPGTRWDYSNVNYLLAGLVIEAVTQHRADLEIRRRIIEPLGLHHTSFPLDDPRIPGPHLHGYDMSAHDVTGFNPAGEWTAGAMISTTTDLARFDAALFGGQLLRPAQQRELLNTALDSGYGLGVQRETVNCPGVKVTVWETDGGGPGFTSISMTSTDATRQLVLVANVFDLGRDQRKASGELPFPDAGEAFAKATATVLCP